MVNWAWGELGFHYGTRSERRDRWVRHRIALLRLLGGFRTWIGGGAHGDLSATGTWCGGNIYPGHVGDSAAFEFIIRIRPTAAALVANSSLRPETFEGKLWPTQRDEDWHVVYDWNTGLYTDGREARFEQLFGQLLFSYKVNPRTVVFVGYSDNGYGASSYDLTRADRTLFAKIGYAWVP